MQLEPNARADLDALLELPLRSATGEPTRLRDVVHPVELRAVSRILHRDGVRTATVTASNRADRRRSDMQAAMGIAVLGILTIIALMIGSFLEALFIIAVIPFGAAGVIFAFYLHGKPLSMFAMLGVIGVVVNAAIVMVDAINTRVEAARRDGAIIDNDDSAMIDAVVERLRPILVTTLTTCGGVLPTAYGLGGYDAVLSPMSLALGWGLLFATSITLLLVPCLYRVAQDVRKIVGRLFKRSWGKSGQ